MDENNPTWATGAAPVPLFRGSPSLLVHLPAVLGGLILMALWVFVYDAMQRQWGLHWAWGLIPITIIVFEVAQRILDTAFTRIEINADQIVLTEGILHQRQSILELASIREVRAYSSWWQRVFNLGTVILMTTDAQTPVWRLYGMRHFEQMRQRLDTRFRHIHLQSAHGGFFRRSTDVL